MHNGSILLLLVDGLARETTLFAAIWFFVGGIDDLLVDLAYVARVMRRWLLRIPGPPQLDELPPQPDSRIAIFVAAWDESAVIGTMLRTTLARFGSDGFALYVGVYPNDPATIAAVADVAESDDRVRLVIGPAPGPTTKADCLNAVWRAMLREEVATGRQFRAVVLHDAEDLVHPGELRVFAHYLDRYATVQLPVLPLPHPRSRLISGHYIDEFAEAHAKQLLVRESLGAGMPLAGVGCAVRRDMLGGIAEIRGGAPFDASSLTEDYELGLTVHALGGAAVLARVPEAPGGRPVAVRAYFPDTLPAAVRQKSRWMTGIALAGWDRTGWSASRRVADHWMRMRDRRVTLAMPVLAVAYCALVAWGASAGLHLAVRSPVPMPDRMVAILLAVNVALLTWRIASRATIVTLAYDWRQGLWSVPRLFVANVVSLLAARRAVFLYVRLLAGGTLHWDKTQHQFPDQPEQLSA